MPFLVIKNLSYKNKHFFEKLTEFIVLSDKIALVNEENTGSIPQLRTNSDDNDVINDMSFEILDYSVIPEIEEFFNENDSGLNFDEFMASREALISSLRIESCRETWTYYEFSNGCQAMEACVYCYAGFRGCNSYFWCDAQQ